MSKQPVYLRHAPNRAASCSMNVKSIVLIICFSAFLFSPLVTQADLTAQVDAKQITIEQSLRLVLTSTLANNNEQPDFSVLAKDFDILGRSEQTNVETIGRTMTQSRSWHLELMAKRQGVAIIPAFDIGGETTEAISIEVAAPKLRKPGESKGDYYFEVDVDKNEAFVQSQIIYTLRIFAIQNFLDGSLSEVKSEGLQVQELGDTRSYREVVNGTTYLVLEKKYALFPQRSGEIVVPPVLLNASVPMDGARNRGIFTPSQSIRRKSDAVTITVLPRPDSTGSHWWLPATEIQLDSHWEGDVAELRVGDSLTRNVALLADGVSSTQLPELDVAETPGLKIYTNQPVLDERVSEQGLRSVRQEKWAVVALKPGTFILPEITVPWFNTSTGKTEIAMLPAETLTVLPADNAGVDSSSDSPLPESSQLEENPDRVQGADPEKTGSAENASDSQEQEPPSALLVANLAIMQQRVSQWKWASFLLALGWLFTAGVLGWLLFARYRQRAALERPAARGKVPATTEIITACQSGDMRSSAAALLRWARDYWPDDPPRTLVALGKRIGSVELSSQLSALDSMLYAGSTTGGAERNVDAERTGDVLIALEQSFVKAAEQLTTRVEKNPASGLPPL